MRCRRIRSKPTIEWQQYLDLYVLQRDRFRWKRLMDQAQRSIESIDQALGQMGFTSDGAKLVQTPEPAACAAAAVGRGKTIDLGMTAKRKRSA